MRSTVGRHFRRSGGLMRATNTSNALNAFSYILGQKADGTSNGVPVDVTVGIDADLQKTVFASVGILTVGIGIGIAAGIFIAKRKK